jgi:replicative DNA helicase
MEGGGMTAEEVAGRLQKARRIAGGFTACCPAHDDTEPSLSISTGDGGQVLLCCHAQGCKVEDITAAINITMTDLYPARWVPSRSKTNGATHAVTPIRPAAPPPPTEAQVQAWHAALLADVSAMQHVTEHLGFPPALIEEAKLGLCEVKGRRWLLYPYRREGRWTYAKGRALDTQKPRFHRFPHGQAAHLYGVDDLEQGGTAVLVEGERDAVSARALGLHRELGGDGGASIVSLPDGADSWEKILPSLEGQARIYVLTDSDDAGDVAAAGILRAYPGAAKRVRLEQAKDLGDLLVALGPEAASTEALRQVRAANAANPLAALSVGALLDLEEHKLELGPVRMPTGWPRLDKALGGGLEVPSLTVLGAAPKSGKSTWAQMIAVRHVEAGGVAYCLDLENGRRRFLRGILCRRAEIGPRQAAQALQDDRHGVFDTREDVERWRASKAWLRASLAPSLFSEHRQPEDIKRRLADARAIAGDRQLLVVVDSLQKLQGDPKKDRRNVIDEWIKFFEALRLEFEAALLVISEIRRGKDGYAAREDAFKESGGIEYAADLALTLNRPAADEDEAPALLRAELARDCEEDPRGDVASYRPVRPFYGLEEVDPEPLTKPRHGPPPKKRNAALEFLARTLGDTLVEVQEVMRLASLEGYSPRTIQRAASELPVEKITRNLKTCWRAHVTNSPNEDE